MILPRTVERNRGCVLVLLLVLVGSGCADGPQPADRGMANVLLLSVDTLRADRLGSFGYGRPTSPSVDALAETSVVFEQARSPSPWTLPALASLMTSSHSSSHGIWRFDGRLSDDFDTLAELLAAHGYRTAAVGSHTFLAQKFGLHQGFERFDTSLVKQQLDSHLAVTSPQVTAKGIAWLEVAAESAAPWLLWLHYFDPHAVYQAHEGLTTIFGDATDSERYDGEIAFTDDAIGVLLAALERLGLDDDTIVVFVADHGEEFGDHGGAGHGRTLYREVLHVPLLFRVPGLPPRRVQAAASLVDVLPTLLALLGVPAPAGLEGRDLGRAMRGGAPEDRPILAEVRLHGALESLETRDWKLIRAPGTGAIELYDRREDPKEQHDVARQNPSVVLALEAQLHERVRTARTRGESRRSDVPAALSPREREHLRALGYLD